MFSVLPGGPLPPALTPVTDGGGKGGGKGARSSQARKLDLGGGVGDISQPSSAWNLQRPAISSKSAPHALDISTLRPERLTGKSISGGRLLSGEAAAGARLPAGFQEPKLILCNVSGCGSVYCVCGVLVVNKMKCISEKKSISNLECGA